MRFPFQRNQMYEMQHRRGLPHWLRVEPPRQPPQIHTRNTYRRMFFTDGTHFVPQMVRFFIIILEVRVRKNKLHFFYPLFFAIIEIV